MNREILFRGKRLDNNKWLYGSHFTDSGEDYIIPQNLLGINDYEEYQVDQNTVGQFAGLLDSHGAKIFEGDIIRVREYENLLMNEFFDDADRFDLFTLEEIRGNLKDEYVSPVAFLEGSFQISSRDDNDFDMFLACLFGDMKRSSPSFEFEVIGNIYDNPELLSTK